MDDEAGRGDYFERQKKPWQWTWNTTIIRSVMPAYICLVLAFASFFGQMYADLGHPLSASAILLLRLGLSLRRYWFLIPVFIVVAVAVDYGGYVLLKQYLGDSAAHLWMGFVMACYFVYVGFCAIFIITLSMKVSPPAAPATGPTGAPSGIFRLFR